jgi:osomolarity two-component system phosphorelay intermediate protein YPD1
LAAQGPPKLSDYKEILDESTFEQILEMDDDEEDRDFSRSIVYGFFEQAENTFKKMQKEL